MVVMLDDHTTIHTAFCRVVPGGRVKGGRGRRVKRAGERRREGERGEGMRERERGGA